MSTPAGPRHNPSARQKVSNGKPPNGKAAAARRTVQMEGKVMKERQITDVAGSVGRLFTFTIDATTAQIVKLETQDASGARHELSEQEKATLAKAGSEAGLEQFVERAFEAGIACVLGGAEPDDKLEELADEAELRRLLLTPLIERSSAKRLIEREVLSRAILGTLISHATKVPPQRNQATGLHSDRAAPAGET